MRTPQPRRRSVQAFLVVALMVAAVIPASAPFASAAEGDSTGVSYTLEGCRNTGSITLPDGNGNFICPTAAYTTGNLGKGWNELDLVPYRLTLDAGNSAPASQTYKVAAVLDHEDAGAPGYDVISAPVLNVSLSDVGCIAATSTGQLETTNFGGIDRSIYRMWTVTQLKNTECVYDYYGRLALGSHLFPGSSLHANKANQHLTTAGVGAADVSIPVKEILPQELRKTMTASQGSDHIWDIWKEATPATLTFNNTCLNGTGDRSAGVEVTVRWEKRAATASGPITIITHVYAKNPASRVITVDVSDDIRSGTTVLDTASSGPVDVPANTELEVLTHQTEVAAGTGNLNDVATATYTDKVTGVAVPGNTTAEASATVQPSGATSNATATITDVEDITGADLSFSVDSTTGASGTFSGGYTLGTVTKDPVTWTSGTQTGNGSVTFNKTVIVDGPANTTGTLSDTATLTGSNGFSANASASTSVTANATVSLTIDKTIPVVLGAGDSNQTFTFDITGPNSYVGQAQITFTSGEGGASDINSTTISGLEPGSYTVSEQALAPYAPQPDQVVDLTLPVCSGTASFNNGFGPASARVQKVTVPPGSSTGWEFTLTGPGTPAGGEVKTATAGAGYVDFDTDLQEGAYTITETDGPAGYDETGSSTECSFTVNYPADADRVFSCTKTNTQRGHIIIDKVTVPAGDPQSFDFTLDGGPSALDQDFSLTDAATPHDSGAVLPGNGYSAAETVPEGWKRQSATCDDGSPVTNIDVSAGETVTCTFTNKKLGTVVVNKTVNGQPLQSGQSYTFQVRQGASGTSHGTVIATDVANFANGGVADFDPPTSTGGTTKFVAPKYFVPGNYQLCETLAPFWSVDMGGGEFVPTLMDDSTVDNSTRCVNFSITSTDLNKVFNVNNIPPPSGDARTIGFWKNWSGNCTGGKQANVLQNTLNLGAIMIGDLSVDQACSEAVPILNKSDIVSKKKLASHPAYNLAAQLLAAKLNDQRGVPLCGAAVNAAANAQTLLANVNFDGTETNGATTMNATQKANANNYAGILDDFNNNTLACP